MQEKYERQKKLPLKEKIGGYEKTTITQSVKKTLSLPNQLSNGFVLQFDKSKLYEKYNDKIVLYFSEKI